MGSMSMSTGYQAVTQNRSIEILRIGDVLTEMLKPGRRQNSRRVETFADSFKIGESTLYQYMEGRRDFPARLVPALTRITGDPLMIEQLCESCGGVFVPLPDGGDLESVGLASTIAEFGDLARVAGDAIRDGQITQDEAGRIAKEGHEAIQAIHALITEAQAQAAENERAPVGRVTRLSDTMPSSPRNGHTHSGPPRLHATQRPDAADTTSYAQTPHTRGVRPTAKRRSA